MFYVIQTNTSLNGKNEPIDFQSCMYKITKQTWNEFKDYITSNEKFTYKIIQGTMLGGTKPSNCVVEEILINDNFHLEIILSYGRNGELKVNNKYYMVTEESFKNLL